MSTFIISQNAVAPILVATLTDVAGNAVDLTAALSVVFRMTSADGVTQIVNAPATVISPATGGRVSYSWQPADTANPGTYLSRFIVTFVDSSVMQFPDRGFDHIVVAPAIPSIAPLASPGWNYSGDPMTTPRDQVRFLIGDTDSTDQLLQDAEIDWLVSIGGDPFYAAAEACRQLAARFARLADNKRLGDLSVSYALRARRFLDLETELRLRAQRGGYAPTPYASGWNQTDKQIDQTNPDIVYRLYHSTVPDIYDAP